MADHKKLFRNVKISLRQTLREAQQQFKCSFLLCVPIPCPLFRQEHHPLFIPRLLFSVPWGERNPCFGSVLLFSAWLVHSYPTNLLDMAQLSRRCQETGSLLQVVSASVSVYVVQRHVWKSSVCLWTLAFHITHIVNSSMMNICSLIILSNW